MHPSGGDSLGASVAWLHSLLNEALIHGLDAANVAD